jgi:hypothetical protein
MSINRGLGFASVRGISLRMKPILVYLNLDRGRFFLRTSTVPGGSWSEDRADPLTKVRLGYHVLR